MNKREKSRIIYTITIPFLILSIMWLVKIFEFSFNVSFYNYGVSAKNLTGLRGIVLSPFIHKDFNHLINNSYPIIILGSILFAFYKDIAYKILIWIDTLKTLSTQVPNSNLSIFHLTPPPLSSHHPW